MRVNPHYVSRLLGPLALTVAKDRGSELFSSVDYSNKEQSRLVIESLIAPSFERLKDSTKWQVAKALAYFSSRPNASSDVIEEKLLLCEIPPAHHLSFLVILWEFLFPGESAAAVAEEVKGVVNRPLTAGEFAFEKKEAFTLDELVDNFRARMQG